MLEEIIISLGDNYDINDNRVLVDLVNDMTHSALSITNRETIDGLEDIIKRSVISAYLQRGSEGTKSKSQLGISETYEDIIKKMEYELIVEGKRRIW